MTANQENKMIDDLEQPDPLCEGENQAYLISKTWYKSFGNSPQQKSETIPEESQTSQLPPIDNKGLVLSDGKFNSSKKENIDFVVETPKVWGKLSELYGGGPPVSVPVVSLNSYTTYLRPVLEKMEIRISFNSNDNCEIFETYKEIKVSQLLFQIKNHFSVPENVEAHLHYRGKALDTNKTLEAQFVHQSCQLILITEGSNFSAHLQDQQNQVQISEQNSVDENIINKSEESNTEKVEVSQNVSKENDQNDENRDLNYNMYDADIPSPQEQGEIIKELNNSLKFKVGDDEAFFISIKWYNFWKESTDAHVQLASPIPPIDNTDLFDQNSEKPNRLKMENTDFVIVYPKVWEKLHSWFGGGPPLPAPVCEDILYNEIYPITKYMTVYVSYEKQIEIPFEAYEKQNIGEFHKIVREYFEIPAELQTCLFYINKLDEISSFECYLIKNGERLTLSDSSKISDSQSESSSSNSTTRLTSSDRALTTHELYQPRTNFPRLSFEDPHYSNTYYNRNPLAPGVCGLHNIGNTCFFNSGLQCLVHTRRLVNYLLSDKWSAELNVKNPIGMRGELAEAFADFTSEVWSGVNSCITPKRLKDVIGRFAPQFSGYGQQDSHELITFLLDGIHEDLNRVTNKPIVDGINGDGTNDEAIADESWRRYKSRNNSVIIDLFHSQLRSTLVCPVCKKVTVVFDPYMSLQLPISRPNFRKFKVVFIPYGFKRDYYHIEITLKKNRDFPKAISKKIGRSVSKVLICYKESFYGSKPSYRWGLSEANDITHFVLEIPSEDQYYVACSIINEENMSISYSTSYKCVCPPTLIPVSSLDISADALNDACDSYFSFMWKSPAQQFDDLTTAMITFRNSLKMIRADDSLGDNNRFISTRRFMALTANDEQPNVSSQIITLTINPKYVVNNDEFLFSMFLRHCGDVSYRLINNSDNKTEDKKVTLKKCFEYFSRNETLDEKNQWLCPLCRKFVCADKKMDIWSAPEILVIQLKRFRNLSKNETPVYYPSKIDISPYLVGPQKKENMNYRLYAVSEHSGWTSGGHYTAHARVSDPNMSEEGGKWYNFNDSYVHESHEKDAHNEMAYVLFYERIDSEPSTMSSADIEAN